jgi:hypothetical protein
MVTMRLERGVPPLEAGAARVAAALRDSARPGDGLEHVFAQQTGQGVNAVLFLVALGPGWTAVTAYVLYQRAKPTLSGYRLAGFEIGMPAVPGRPAPMPRSLGVVCTSTVSAERGRGSR